VSGQTIVLDIPAQNAISRDNVSIGVDAVSMPSCISVSRILLRFFERAAGSGGPTSS
jgi:hypothetical protein